MCGIIGYVGARAATPILLSGLRRLEYRGYDSAGLAVHDGKTIQIVRAVGKLVRLDNALSQRPLPGCTGIGHTRWATHGRPVEHNAHPHSAGDIAVVHNGIIENHVSLRRKLESHGARFSSDTDTEIAAHLIDRALRSGERTLLEAVRVALQQVEGAYAIAVLSRCHPDRLVVARNSSPLVLGLGDGETFCGSDIPALLPHTKRMIFLEDGELAEIDATGAHIEKLDGTQVERVPKHIDWSPLLAERGGYKHFMLKEIHEQPRALEDTLRGRVDLDSAIPLLGGEAANLGDLRELGRVYLIACGTSHHAALAGRYWIEQLARIPTTVELASEVRYRDPVFRSDDLVIAVSQSGETLDTMAAVRAARASGVRVLAIANVLDSAIPRSADATLYTHAGPEIGVASTKCFTAQLAALLLLAVELGRCRETLSIDRARSILHALVHVSNAMRTALEEAPQILRIARRYHTVHDMLFLGRGLGFPIALEGALKLKEISYIHAEAYAAGEMKHGPIALIDRSMPVVFLAPRDSQYEKTISNLQEVRAREGQIIAVATRGDREIEALAEHVIWIPELTDESVLPLVTVVPLQLLAYYMADLKGTDVDQPRNLAKTVTVE